MYFIRWCIIEFAKTELFKEVNFRNTFNDFVVKSWWTSTKFQIVGGEHPPKLKKTHLGVFSTPKFENKKRITKISLQNLRQQKKHHLRQWPFRFSCREWVGDSRGGFGGGYRDRWHFMRDLEGGLKSGSGDYSCWNLWLNKSWGSTQMYTVNCTWTGEFVTCLCEKHME